MLILQKDNICRRHGKIDTNVCYCFLVPIQDHVLESSTTLCSKISLVPMCSWDGICNACNFSSCLLYMKPVYTQSVQKPRSRGTDRQSSPSCWAHRTDRTRKAAAQASPASVPAVKLHLSRACDLIQINLAINLGKTEKLISRIGTLDLLRKGHQNNLMRLGSP